MARIQRVLPILLKVEKNKDYYIPKVVSIGPYHHGKPELARVEAFKLHAVDSFVSGGPRNMDFYYCELLGIMGEIRECYEEGSAVDYSDDQLARMMLHDACFIINFMAIFDPVPEKPYTGIEMLAIVNNLGLLMLAIAQRDILMLENQIPLCVIKLLMKLRCKAGEYENLLHRYLNFSIFGEYRQKGVLKMEFESAEPLYLLEAFYMLLTSDFVKPKKTGCGGYKCRRLCSFNFKVEQSDRTLSDGGGGMIVAGAAPTRRWLCCPRSKCFDVESGAGPTMTMILGLLGCKKAEKNPQNEFKMSVIHSFRSVTDLKAKGIYLKPSPTRSLKDVDFKSYFFYATLQLPYWYVSPDTKAFFLNMIAYELRPNNNTQWEVTSYISLMKSLMERKEDVKELREKGILYNQLGSDEEVLSVYKDLNTYGTDNPEIFGELKDKIQAHYKSYTKTWMAELIHTYFRTPWTVIAFLAAISLLAISAAQLYYAVHPNS